METTLTAKSFREKKIYSYLVDALFFVVAFFITFLIYVLIFQSLGFYPFNEDGLTTMMLDQRDQYISYMRAYQYALRNGESLVYSLGKVFGGDFQSLFTYYLSSPFNLFVVFVDSADIPQFFFYTSIIKMSFASGNMYLLARYVSKKRRIGFLPFSIAYGLISYAFVYLSNFMYLDGLMILPLVMFGMIGLKENKNLYVYPFALAYALLSNWYLGAMICMFLVVYFLLSFCFMKGNIHTRLAYLLRFVIFSLVGGMLSSFVWLTAFLHFDGTKASLQLPSFTFFNWASFFEGLLENNYLSRSDISRNTGYMTMFVSVVTLIFAQLFFTNKKFSWREKVIDGSLLLVYFTVSLSSVLNALFHGGREPTWFPTRYSFIIGFYLCYLANKESSELEETPIWGSAIPAGTALILLPILCFAQKNSLGNKGEEILYPLSSTSLMIFIIALAITALYLLFIFVSNKKDIKVSPLAKNIVEIGLLVLTVVSSYRGGVKVVEANIKDNSYQEYSAYKKDDDATLIFDAVKEYDSSSFYRMEATFNRPYGVNTINNNPMFYSYNGLNHYSSTEKKYISSYMRRIGFHRNGFWERYDAGSTEAMNSFLGIKYLIDDSSSSKNKPQFLYNDSSLNLFNKMDLTTIEGYTYYQNDYALPLGFVTNAHSSTYVSQGKNIEGYKETYWYDHFEYQNEMFKDMTDGVKNDDGSSKEIFHKINIEKETLLDGTLVLKEDEFGRKKYHLEKGSSIKYVFKIPLEARNNTLYLFEKAGTANLNYYLDGQKYDLMDYWNSGIHSFNATVGTTHTLTVTYSKDTPLEAEIIPEIYYEDLSTLREYLTLLKAGGANDLKKKSAMNSFILEGTFTFERDDGEFLFTLPYDTNFSIYVDGKKKETLKRFDIFTAVSLSGIEKGQHEIKIVYHDKGLTAGSIISSIAFVGSIPLIIFYPKLEKKIFKKKEENE